MLAIRLAPDSVGDTVSKEEEGVIAQDAQRLSLASTWAHIDMSTSLWYRIPIIPAVRRPRQKTVKRQLERW